jgi:signal transduction histidine kinase
MNQDLHKNPATGETENIPSVGAMELFLLEVELLKKIDLFTNFSDESIKSFLDGCEEILLKGGETLFEEGVPAEKMYIILSGYLGICKLNKRIAVLGAGDFVGEMSLIESMDRSATAEALGKQVLLIEVGEDHFKKFLTSDPYALFSMMKTLSGRLRSDLDSMSKEMQRLSNFTHDMKNCLVPLGITEDYLDEIRKTLQGTEENHSKRKGWEKAKKSFDTILSVKNNLLVMIEQSLACVRKTKFEYVKTELDILQLIEETVEEISYHNVLRTKKILTHTNGDIQKCHINYLDIKRVLQNLLVNAAYASKAEGTIEIHVENLDDGIQISVKDYGSGIPDKVKPLLFKESFTTRADGNGFGLMSCREIIEDFHDGKIFFESAPGMGTTFHFTLKTSSNLHN